MSLPMLPAGVHKLKAARVRTNKGTAVSAQDAVSLVMPARARCVYQAVSIVASTFGIAVVQASAGGDALEVKAVYRQVPRDVLRSYETIGEMLGFGSSARSKCLSTNRLKLKIAGLF